jgi:hypothetical protein
MSSPFNREWCRLAWQVLLYLNATYDSLNDAGLVRVQNEGWGADTGTEGGKPEAHISFDAKPANAGRAHIYLWIGLWFNENGAEGDRPIWIQVMKDDRQLWERLKSEFKEALVYDTDDYGWTVGLEWTLPINETNDEVRTVGKALADRISKVLVP